MGPFLGRDCVIEILVGKDSRSKVDGIIPKPVAPDDDYVVLGGTRGLDDGAEWDTVDATSRSSAGNVRESVVTFLSVTGSTNGVYLPETAANIAATREYFLNPPSGQPYAWIRTTYPGPTEGSAVTEELYALMTSFNRSSPHDDVATFDLAWDGQQPTIKTAVPAP